MKWYAVYTKPKTEKKVAERLQRENVAVYCPLVKELSQWSDRKKWIYRPVLTSYLFVNISDSELLRVREVPGVVNFVYWLGKPAVIRDEEINRLKKFVEFFPGAGIQDDLPFEVGDEVEFNYGPLRGVKGIILNKLKNKARVRLDSLGLEITAKVNLEDLKLNYANK